jgi:multiple sugar transport system substrate-binding protein
MRRREFSLVIALCLIVTGSVYVASGIASPRAHKAVTLSFWTGFTGGDRPAYEGMIAQFNATHPGIQVTMDVQPWDTIAQKLPTALATGQGPDLATPDYNVATIIQYIKAGTIAPLDAAYGEGSDKVQTGALASTIVKSFTLGGHIYAVPANFATLLLYYNKKLFAQAGIRKPPATMAEMRADAVKLTNTSKHQYGIALADHQTIPMWPILMWAEGGDITNQHGCATLTNQKTVAAINSWATLVATKGISPVGLTGQGADNLFAAQKAAMEINGPWAVGEYTPAKVSYDTVPVPIGASGKHVTLASTVPIVVNKASKNLPAVYTFLAWWTSKSAQEYLAVHSGFPPARTDMANDKTLATNTFVPKFAAAVPYARLYLPKVEKFAQADGDVITPMIGRVTRGANVAKTLASANKDLKSLLGC